LWGDDEDGANHHALGLELGDEIIQLEDRVTAGPNVRAQTGQVLRGRLPELGPLMPAGQALLRLGDGSVLHGNEGVFHHRMGGAEKFANVLWYLGIPSVHGSS